MTLLLHTLAALVLLTGGDNGEKVYFGKVKDAKKPAACVAGTVFKTIPEYQEIVDKGLTQNDASYWVLLAKANEKFYKAVEAAAKAGDYDCVVESGSVKFDTPPPDVTQNIIGALK